MSEAKSRGVEVSSFREWKVSRRKVWANGHRDSTRGRPCWSGQSSSVYSEKNLNAPSKTASAFFNFACGASDSGNKVLGLFSGGKRSRVEAGREWSFWVQLLGQITFIYAFFLNVCFGLTPGLFSEMLRFHFKYHRLFSLELKSEVGVVWEADVCKYGLNGVMWCDARCPGFYTFVKMYGVSLTCISKRQPPLFCRV